MSTEPEQEIPIELRLTDSEQTALSTRKAHFPFRYWTAVKVEGQEAEYFDTKRRLNAALKKLRESAARRFAVWSAQ